jgi:hypothetical protein
MASRRRGPDGLTEFERDLCREVDRGLGDREAYRAVRPHSTASRHTVEHYVRRVRQRPHCAAYLKALKAKSLARHMDRKDRIIEELATVAFADIGDLLTSGPEGLKVRPIGELPPALRRALAWVSISHTAHGGTVRLGMHDKLSALDKLCRMFGLYRDGRDAGAGPDGAAVAMSDVDRAQRLAAILRLAGKGADGPADETGDSPSIPQNLSSRT